MKTCFLKTSFGEYQLKIIKSNYSENNKLYYGLYDIKDGEPFSDVTVNLNTGVKDFENYNFIDCDFIELCFGNKIDNCKKRLKENLKIKGFGKVLGYYYFTL